MLVFMPDMALTGLLLVLNAAVLRDHPLLLLLDLATGLYLLWSSIDVEEDDDDDDNLTPAKA